MKKAVCFLLALIFCNSLFAWSGSTQIHGLEADTDNGWNAVSILDDSTKQESIWAFRSSCWWDNPRELIAFKPHGGWTFPSVCYDRQTKSFIVYHHCWFSNDEGNDGGIYEFTYADDKYRSSRFYRTEENTPYVENGKLLSNDYGVYLLATYGKFTGKEDRNARLFKLVRDGNFFTLETPECFAETEFSHLDWRNESKPDKHDIYRNVFEKTDRALILKDVDDSSWWYFDCNTELAEKFSTKEEAFEYENTLKTSLIINEYLENNPKSDSSKIWIIISVCLFVILLVLAAVLIIILSKKRKPEISIKDVSTKDLNRFTFDIQEKERAKISRDIHDSVVQDIRVIRLETENLKVQEESISRQNKIEDIATDCIVKLRNICYNLTPVELINHNDKNSSQIELISIINSLSQQFTSRTHVPCTVGVQEGFEYPPLEKEVTQNLFRVIQEALTNIEKHSYATQTSIYIKKDEQKIIIYITDDGIGCNPDEIAKFLNNKEHLGLRSMKDRMELIGGTIDFISSKDNGMEVKITIGVN